MLYKIGFETFNGSVTSACSPPLFTASADFLFGCNSNLSLVHWGGDERYGKLGTLNGLNLLCQVYTIKQRLRGFPLMKKSVLEAFSLRQRYDGCLAGTYLCLDRKSVV